MNNKQIIAALKKPRDEKSVKAAKAWLKENAKSEEAVAVCLALLEYQRTAKNLTWLAKWFYQHPKALERFVEQTKLDDLLRLLVKCEELEDRLGPTSSSELYTLIVTMTNERTVKLAWRFIEEFPDSDAAGNIVCGLLLARPVRANFDLARRWLFADRKRTGRDTVMAKLIGLDFSEDLVPEALMMLKTGPIRDCRYGLCRVGLSCGDARIRGAVLQRFRRIRPKPRADVGMDEILALAYCTEDEGIAKCVTDWCDDNHSASFIVWEYALDASTCVQVHCLRWLEKHGESPAFERVLAHYLRAMLRSGNSIEEKLLHEAWRLTERGAHDANILLRLDTSRACQRRVWKWVQRCDDEWAGAEAIVTLLGLKPTKSEMAYAVKWALSNPNRLGVVDALFRLLPRKQWTELMSQILGANKHGGYYEQSLGMMLRASKSMKLLQECKERVQSHVELGRMGQIGSVLLALLKRAPKDEELKKTARRWLNWHWQGRGGGELARKVRELS